MLRKKSGTEGSILQDAERSRPADVWIRPTRAESESGAQVLCRIGARGLRTWKDRSPAEQFRELCAIGKCGHLLPPHVTPLPSPPSPKEFQTCEEGYRETQSTRTHVQNILLLSTPLLPVRGEETCAQPPTLAERDPATADAHGEGFNSQQNYSVLCRWKMVRGR